MRETPDKPRPVAGGPNAQPKLPSSQPILMRALRWGAIVTVALMVVAGGVGYLIAGGPGLAGGVIGAAFAGLFLGLTVGSIAFANRYAVDQMFVAMFFGIVVGGWLLKFVLFLIAAFMLRDQAWLDPKILFFALIVSVVVSLVVDVIIMLKSKLPYVSDPIEED